MDKVLALGARDCGFKSRPGDAGSNPVAATPPFLCNLVAPCKGLAPLFTLLQGGWPLGPLSLDTGSLRDELACRDPVCVTGMYIQILCGYTLFPAPQ